MLASVRERYTTVKRLVVRPGPTSARTDAGRNVVVEVQFTGPQPSEGPGALLLDLLSGTSVEAKPVELPRGRKKRARTDASSEASDSGERDKRAGVGAGKCALRIETIADCWFHFRQRTYTSPTAVTCRKKERWVRCSRPGEVPPVGSVWKSSSKQWAGANMSAAERPTSFARILVQRREPQKSVR